MSNAFTVFTFAIVRSPFVLLKTLLGKTASLSGVLAIFAIDGGYTLLNLLLPKKKRGSIIAKVRLVYNRFKWHILI